MEVQPLCEAAHVKKTIFVMNEHESIYVKTGKNIELKRGVGMRPKLLKGAVQLFLWSALYLSNRYRVHQVWSVKS